MGMMRFTNLHIPNDKLRGKRRPHHSWGQVSVFYLVIRVRYFIFSLQWGRRCRHMLCDRCIRKHKRLWSAFQLWVHLAEPGIQFINQIIIDILPMKHELGWWGSAHMLTPSSTGATGQHTTIFIANTRTLCNGSKLRLALNILGCLLRVFPCRRSVICYNPEHPTFPVEWWLPGGFWLADGRSNRSSSAQSPGQWCSLPIKIRRSGYRHWRTVVSDSGGRNPSLFIPPIQMTLDISNWKRSRLKLLQRLIKSCYLCDNDKIFNYSIGYTSLLQTESHARVN